MTSCAPTSPNLNQGKSNHPGNLPANISIHTLGPPLLDFMFNIYKSCTYSPRYITL